MTATPSTTQCIDQQSAPMTGGSRRKRLIGLSAGAASFGAFMQTQLSTSGHGKWIYPTTASRSSRGLKPFRFPMTFHAFMTMSFTSFAWHRSGRDFSFKDGIFCSTARRRAGSAGWMTAMGCLAFGVACTQIFATRSQDL